MRWDHGHDKRRCGCSRWDPGALSRHESSQHGGQAAKPRGNKDADVVQRHAHSQAIQQVPHANRCELHAGINGRADRPPKWIPRAMIKPLEELLNAVLRGGVQRERMVNRSWDRGHPECTLCGAPRTGTE